MLVTITGCDGAGKSTVIPLIRERLASRGLGSEVLGKWDVLDRNRFAECSFISQNLNELRMCISDMKGDSRAMFLFWLIRITSSKADLARMNFVSILDGYWMKHAAAELVYGCDEALIRTHVRAFLKPDITFCLDVEPEIALARKAGNLTPYECGRRRDLSEESFLSHQAAVREILQFWSLNNNWNLLAANKASNPLADKIADTICEQHYSLLEKKPC